MEEIFSYSQYDKVLCLHFIKDKSLIISRSSNRLIMIDAIKRVDIDTISVKDELLEFFKLHSINEHKQTSDEKIRLSSIIGFFKELKHDMIQKDISIFDKSQILFCLPAQWTEDKYENDLRALFLKAGWINREDHKNRLIFSAFIERFVHCANKYYGIKFERERKYLLLHLDETSMCLICYQMQSAKELIAVSKKLAVSDFLLTPTVLDDEAFCLSSLDKTIRNKVERMLITRQNTTNTTLEKPELCSLIDEILRYLNYLFNPANLEFDTPLATFLNYTGFFNGNEMAQEYMKLLEGWTYGTFMKEILNDTDIKQLNHRVADSFKRIHGKYSQVKSSPDGVQAIVLYDDFYLPEASFKNMVLDVLNAKNTGIKIEFIEIFFEPSLTEAAMQKPYKMIQIANALSSPDILNKENLSLYPNSIQHGWRENDLLQPNSFYVQAYVYENHINFILNKVVAVSSIDDIVKKSTFTIHERSINVENIADTTCDIIWNHFQVLDFEDYGNMFFQNCCDEHSACEFNAENYFNFKANLKVLMRRWFQDENIFSDQGLDIYQSISININCKCALNITYRILIEVALRPSIDRIATAITSTLSSNDLFGLYDVCALIIINDSKNVALNKFNRILKEAIVEHLQVHQKSPVVFHGKKDLVTCKLLGYWANDIKQILGIGSYLQISSTSYVADIYQKPQEVNDSFDYSSKNYGVSRTKQAYNFYILKKDDCLHQEGVIKRYFIGDFNDNATSIVQEIYMFSSSQASESRSRIMVSDYYQAQFKYPVTIKISPQHYSSTIKIDVSYVKGGTNAYENSESIIIHEKLILRQQ